MSIVFPLFLSKGPGLAFVNSYMFALYSQLSASSSLKKKKKQKKADTLGKNNDKHRAGRKPFLEQCDQLVVCVKPVYQNNIVKGKPGAKGS